MSDNEPRPAGPDGAGQAPGAHPYRAETSGAAAPPGPEAGPTGEPAGRSADRPAEGGPQTAWEAEGSPLQRLRHPVTTGGEPAERGGTASTAEAKASGGLHRTMGVEPEQAAPGIRPPRRRLGRRPRTEESERARQAAMERPSDEDATHRVPLAFSGEPLHEEHVDPGADRRAELQISGLFLLSVIGTLLFCIGFFVVDLRGPSYGKELNYVLGAGLTLSMAGIGAALVVWAKKLMPHEKAVQERGDHFSPAEDQLAAEETFLKGVSETGFARRPILRRAMIAAMALFPLPLIIALRDLGPLPRQRLRVTTWTKDARLVDMETRQPIKLGDVPIGGLVTVMPEDFESPETAALSPTILIRLQPNVLRLPPDRKDWAVYDHVAYSKICTHAGCPVGLFEDQTHHLLCPCHQSTFDAANGAKVVFGPAARPLPILPIYVDDKGYFRARSEYQEPIGPSFWERG